MKTINADNPIPIPIFLGMDIITSLAINGLTITNVAIANPPLTNAINQVFKCVKKFFVLAFKDFPNIFSITNNATDIIPDPIVIQNIAVVERYFKTNVPILVVANIGNTYQIIPNVVNKQDGINNILTNINIIFLNIFI